MHSPHFEMGLSVTQKDIHVKSFITNLRRRAFLEQSAVPPCYPWLPIKMHSPELDEPDLQRLKAMLETRNPAGQAGAFAEVVGRLTEAYAQDMQKMWHKIYKFLEQHDVSSAPLDTIRERGIALARLERLCNPGAGERLSRHACIRALENYNELLSTGRPARRHRGSHTQSFLDFMGTGPSSETHASVHARRLFEDILEQGLNISVETIGPEPSGWTSYNMHLVGPGEPQQESGRADHVSSDYVRHYDDPVRFAVEYGALELGVSVAQKEIYVKSFGRNLRRRAYQGRRRSAMAQFFCASMAALAGKLQGSSEDLSEFHVKLVAADKGNGKLLEFYESLGFTGFYDPDPRVRREDNRHRGKPAKRCRRPWSTCCLTAPL